MGYDMYVVDSDGRVVDESNDHLYLRRNMAGGARLAHALVDAGMGYWPLSDGYRQSGPPSPENVQWQDDGTYDGRWIGDGADEWHASQLAHLRATWDEQPGISVYKLCYSNDGWWVTKAECESALKLWEQRGKPEIDQYRDVIPFLRLAAEHSGFRVW